MIKVDARLLVEAKEKINSLKEVYDKCNELLAVVGAEGTINAQDDVCVNLMVALRDFDGGEWNTKKMFPED